MVEVLLPDGSSRRGQVIEFSDRYVLVQILEQSTGIDVLSTRIRFSGSPARMPLSRRSWAAVSTARGIPSTGFRPCSPRRGGRSAARRSTRSPEKPSRPIVTGISAIDGLNTLLRGQKLPIFSAAGCPPGKSRRRSCGRPDRRGGTGVLRRGEPFAVVFAAMGITFRQASYFLHEFEHSGAAGRTVVFQNLADDPTIERLLTPRFALTAAEYLAFDHGFDVLVILTDMTNYCDALREIATAGRRSRTQELPRLHVHRPRVDLRTRRVHPGEERSVTQLPILTMPDDDITHPVPT